MILVFVFCHAVMSVSCSIAVTCWKRAGLLAVWYAMFFCAWSLSHTVSGLGVELDCIDS